MHYATKSTNSVLISVSTQFITLPKVLIGVMHCVITLINTTISTFGSVMHCVLTLINTLLVLLVA